MRGLIGVSAAMSISLLVLSAPLRAAQIDQTEYQQLVARAQEKGATRVMVHLESVSLDALASRSQALRARLAQKSDALLAELGPAGAWTAGYWNNDAGQIGIYVTPEGLKVLASSTIAISFGSDPTDQMRSAMYSGDDRLQAIERAIDEQGSARVSVTLNTAAAEFDFPSTGEVRWKRSPTAQAEFQAAHSNLLASLNAVAPSANRAVARNDTSIPVATMTIGRQDLIHLRESKLVRSMRLEGWTDKRSVQLAPEVLAEAARNGSARVVIEFRRPDPMVAAHAHLPPQATAAQAAVEKRVAAEIVGNFDDATDVTDLSGLGAVAVTLSSSSLARLFANPDRRILRVDLNRPVAVAGLANSTRIVNMQSAWTQGWRAAGQNIVIFDSGIRKSHAFFTTNGTSRVVFEACWGTNNVDYKSPCPRQDAKGDSPPGLAGSGEPAAICIDPKEGSCIHGTHVAGIAAGRASSQLPAGLQGMAPDASLIAVQVFSFPTTGRGSVFLEDLLLGLQQLQGVNTDNYVANLSLGTRTDVFSRNCDSWFQSVANVINALHQKNIPVVVATMNANQKDGIAFPACVSNAIKVAGTLNESNGDTVANQMNGSNILPDGVLVGPVLLAPGYSVKSASSQSNTETVLMEGTSQAAPHVAGLYAAIKAAVPGVTNAGATAWIYGTGSVSAPQNLNGSTYPFRRIRMP